MKEVSINKDMKLSEHFSLGELTKTSYITSDGNIPSRKAIENLKNICENWLEDLRYSQNTLYGDKNGDIPIIIKCYGPEQMIRMAGILLDIADGTKRDYDELILEKRGTTYWIHFAVRPKDNRRKILFDCK